MNWSTKPTFEKGWELISKNFVFATTSISFRASAIFLSFLFERELLRVKVTHYESGPDGNDCIRKMICSLFSFFFFLLRQRFHSPFFRLEFTLFLNSIITDCLHKSIITSPLVEWNFTTFRIGQVVNVT